MAYLAAAIAKPIPEEQLEVYFNELGRFEAVDFCEAVQRSIRGLQDNFLPSIGVLYRHACDAALKRTSLQETASRRIAANGVSEQQREIRKLLQTWGRLPKREN